MNPQVFDLNSFKPNQMQQWMLYQQMFGNPAAVGPPLSSTNSTGMVHPAGAHQFLANDRQVDFSVPGLMNPLFTAGAHGFGNLSMGFASQGGDPATLSAPEQAISMTLPSANNGGMRMGPVLQPVQNLNTHVEQPATHLCTLGMSEKALSSHEMMPRRKRNQNLINVIHARAHDLMGISKRHDKDRLRSVPLPDPLQFGEEPRCAPDGTHLWNPDWHENSTFPINHDFLQAIADLILDQEKRMPSLSCQVSRTDVVDAARQYFRTLRRTYEAQTTEAGEKKRARKNTMAYRRNRKKAKCNEHRQQIYAFRNEYGQDETKGLEQIVLTDYMSSEHSDYGAVEASLYVAHRRQNGGDQALEIRREMWRSNRLNRVYARLQSLADKARRHNAGTSGGLTRTKAGKNRLVRYRGHQENANLRCPPRGVKTPFISLVSKSWAKSTGNLDVHMVADPDAFTILSFDVPDLDLDLEDLRYLADEEDAASEPDEADGGGNLDAGQLADVSI